MNMRLQNALEPLLQDFRYTLRVLRRSPAAFALGASIFAVGVGTATGVFSVVDRLLFRSPPYRHAERLVWLGMKAPISENEAGECDINEQEPFRVQCAQFAANFLSTLGVQPVRGRIFSAAEDVRNGPRAVLASHEFWVRRYGADPTVPGRSIVIDGRPARIAGVLPSGFELPTMLRPDVVLPQQLNIAPNVSSSFLTVLGRLKPGITLEQARAALQPIYQESLKEVPAGFAKDITFHVASMRERRVRRYRAASIALLAGVAGLLLIS